MNVQSSRPKGPPVWLDMDQQALDDAYDQEVYAPNRALVVARRHAASERARTRIGNPKRVAYGPTEIEALDIFDCGIRNAPINIFVHGGAWRRNKAADYALLAEPLVRAGAHCVILDFINVDEAGGDLFPMYDQVRRGIAWVARNAETFGGDRNRIFCRRIRRARISPAACSRGAGARRACRPISSRARCCCPACTT